MHFCCFFNLVIVMSPENTQIVSVANNIVDADVTCNEKEKLALDEAVVLLDALIVKAETVLGRLLYALDNATGTRAVPFIGQLRQRIIL